MRPLLPLYLFFSATAMLLLSCRSNGIEKPAIPDQSFTEEFDTLQAAYNRGWRFFNKSESPASKDWVEGSISGDLQAYSVKGGSKGFITADYESTTAPLAVISNWAVSPAITMQNGDRIIFYTKALLYLDPGSSAPGGDSTDYTNRLQVRINKTNEGLNVGNARDAAHFATLLLDINRDYIDHHTNPALHDPRAYPANWTKFEVTINGLAEPTKGRFAFRYYLENGGTFGRGSEVGIDSVAYISRKSPR